MKNLLSFLVILLFSASAYASFFDDADAFFSKYVSDGRVDYQKIAENIDELDKLVEQIDNTTLKLSPAIDKKAFYINAYNILVIKGITDNYPVESPLKVDGFFDKIKYPVAGESLTLNDIENKKIREVYKDARIHFALVCAAVSCPELVPGAYFPSELNRSLKKRTTSSLNNEIFIRVDNSNARVEVSEIFKWYKEDFGGSQNIIQYINKFREEKIPEDYSLGYYTYDWSLNEKK